MLAHVGDDDGVAAGDAPDVVDDMGGVEMAKVGQVLDVAHGRCALAGVDDLEPAGVLCAGNLWQQVFEDLAQIANQSHIHLDVLVDLGWVHFDVDLLGLLRIGADVPVTRSSNLMPQAMSRSAS